MTGSDRNAWLKRRNRGFHVTIRDVDCRDFDVQRFIDDLASMHATFFSFFVGGYVTTYPTQLAYQRESPYLGGRDLAGEIVEAAHAADIKALGMIDLGQVPEQAARDHPDWCAQDAAGRPVERVPGLYAACPMGGYQTDYAPQTAYVREIVAEILGRYPLDCVKFGGGSFGFSRSICYCPNCRRSFYEETGRELPAKSDWSDPLWRTYTTWRIDHARQRVDQLGEVVHAIDPDMPFMGNSVCFGDPDWTVGSSIDVESQAAVADAVQVEVQTRARYDEALIRIDEASIGIDEAPIGTATWQYLGWPAESARFMTSVSDTPIWVVASYFLAWPWRRSAMAPAEQKVYLAQIAANGADPMVNLSGGPPAVHEDPRGFDVIRDLYGFLASHRDYYEGDASGANVAIVYSFDTLFFYGRGEPEKRYVREIRGVEQALHAAHIPFDIISTRLLTPQTGRRPVSTTARTLTRRHRPVSTTEAAGELLDRYAVLVLPNLACMTEEEAEAIRAYVRRGGSIVTTFETSLYDAEGLRRDDYLLSNLLGVRYSGVSRSSMTSADQGYKQVYMDIVQQHPLVDGLEGTSVLPMGGDYCVAAPMPGTTVPLTLSTPFIVFPEGFSYPTPSTSETEIAGGDPLAMIKESETGGRSVYFSGALGSLAWTVPYPDLQRLIANAVRWAADDVLPVRVTAPPTLQVSLRTQASARRMVHLVNLTGGERFFRELVPLHDVIVELRAEAGWSVEKAFLLSDGATLPLAQVDGAWRVTVPRVVDYDVLVFELRQDHGSSRLGDAPSRLGD